jgi:hypothetical protein
VAFFSPVDHYQLSEQHTACIFRIEIEREENNTETGESGDLDRGSELTNTSRYERIKKYCPLKGPVFMSKANGSNCGSERTNKR